MAIVLDHVNHIYEEGTSISFQALTDINLVIPDGQFIGLIGHTGSGKSTLVQHLNGLLAPTSGAIYYNGEDINEKGYSRKTLRSKVGLVFQYPEHQLFETDVFTDVCFGPKNLGLDRKEVELRAYTALKQVGLPDECFYQSPFELSGGQKRRAAIAGVLAMKPEVVSAVRRRGTWYFSQLAFSSGKISRPRETTMAGGLWDASSSRRRARVSGARSSKKPNSLLPMTCTRSLSK